MSEIYQYKCPHCSTIREAKDCTAEYLHNHCVYEDAVFKEYKCKSCGSTTMLTGNALKNGVVCSNCGELNSMELWNKKCPLCGVPMVKQYHIPTYPQIKIISLNDELFYLDYILGKQCKIKECISVNKFLSKICIVKNGKDFWGLADSNNNIVLPCIYLSVEINEFGNISVIYPRGLYEPNFGFESNYLSFDIDLMGSPIHRYYDEANECIKIVKFPKYEAVSNWNSNVAICAKEGKEGLVCKDGTTIIEPMFEKIEIGAGSNYSCQLKGHKYIDIFAGSYGEGLVCVEERNFNESKGIQFFTDRHFNKVIVFDDEWADKNEIPLGTFHINKYTKCHFQNGYLIVDSAVDEYYGHKYRIDRKGNAEYLGCIDYKEFRDWDLAEEL